MLHRLEDRLAPAAIATLDSFIPFPNGALPQAGLVLDGSGNLFGTASDGGASGVGTVFEVAAGSGSITTLASFDNTNGAHPQAGLVLDSSGNLFGTTLYGGAFGYGTVFEMAAGSGTITALASFNGTNGAYSYAGLVQDSSGNLFGTASSGGASGYGTVFEVAVGSGTITPLASFDNTNGTDPLAGLVLGSSGNLFGTTAAGGASGVGTVFEVAAGSGTIATLASFDNTNGANPQAGLVLDSRGNLFGTTYDGGVSGVGTVFEVAAGSGTITTLASFDNTNGAYPHAGLVLDSSGNLFGTASQGGASGNGTVFEVAAGSGTITTLASFNYANGDEPYAGLVLDNGGNLFGTTYDGGAFGFGTVFELAAGSGTITPLASFNGTNGADIFAGLVQDSSGNLFGTTYAAGAFGYGTVFEVAAGSGTITTLASFDNTNGAYPHAGLVLDSSGNLFGTTYAGGAAGDGTVFELAQQIATTTAVTASPNPSLLNQAVTFTATITPAAPSSQTPTGTVQFQIDGSNVGGPVALSGGTASFSTQALTVGTHTIKALYSGDGSFLGSTGSLTQNVHYVFIGFFPPLFIRTNFSPNEIIPIKFRLSDVNGNYVTDLSAVTAVQGIATDSNGNPLSGAKPFNLASADPRGLHHFDNDSDDSTFIFDWKTKGLAASYYEILLPLNDGSVHTKLIQLGTKKADVLQTAAPPSGGLDNAATMNAALQPNTASMPPNAGAAMRDIVFASMTNTLRATAPNSDSSVPLLLWPVFPHHSGANASDLGPEWLFGDWTSSMPELNRKDL
jgi:uncharacterized repeat protein (TIGR03803 family)